MIFRLMVKFNTTERNALVQVAEKELRSLPDQVRVIVREELTRRGILACNFTSDLPKEDAEE